VRRLRVLLDANVIVDAQVRDIFCRMAEAHLIDLCWSGEIIAESRRVLTERLKLEHSKVDRLLATLGRAFPDAVVVDYEQLVNHLELPDPDDRHVLAAAVHGECDWLVTNNVDDFPDQEVDPFDLRVVTVDDALVLLAGTFPTQLAAVVDRQITALRRPAMTRDAFLERLAARAPMGAVAIGTALGIERYTRILGEVRDAVTDHSPQGAVRRLLAAVHGRDHEQTAAFLDPDLARRLTGRQQPSTFNVLEALEAALADVRTTDGWGFATVRRLQGPDIELVKLVRAGNEPLLAFKPQATQGHLLFMRREATDWVLFDLDGPDPAMAQVPEPG
jgi:predicted nucleic acid-binding protein